MQILNGTGLIMPEESIFLSLRHFRLALRRHEVPINIGSNFRRIEMFSIVLLLQQESKSGFSCNFPSKFIGLVLS
jgi:hypothetical protein